MAFERTNLSGNVGVGSNAPKLLTYGTTADNKAAVAASGYFNGVAALLEKGDFILASASDGGSVLNVTSATGVTPVTVAAL